MANRSFLYAFVKYFYQLPQTSPPLQAARLAESRHAATAAIQDCNWPSTSNAKRSTHISAAGDEMDLSSESRQNCRACSRTRVPSDLADHDEDLSRVIGAVTGRDGRELLT